MEYKGYEAIIVYIDDEKEIFYGEVANIKDVVTFQGKNIPELKEAFQDSVDVYLDFCAERGEEPNQPVSDYPIFINSEDQENEIKECQDKLIQIEAVGEEMLNQIETKI